jgi:hypothetical protein
MDCGGDRPARWGACLILAPIAEDSEGRAENLKDRVNSDQVRIS